MRKIQVGDKIWFGDYRWLVLDLQSDRALLITDQMIGQQSYNDFKGEITWADCSLRRYLNDEFYQQFSDEDKNKILQVAVKNNDNPWYGSLGGEDTLDHVFLLSVEEVVCHYFGDSSKILYNKRPKQKYWFGTKDENNKRRMALLDDCMWWWWLRSPGRNNIGAAYIHGDGHVGIQGNGTFKYNSKTIHPISKENYGGIRPALWIKID